ncbi:MAG: hypothetical protein JJ896_14185 [Rhodothermales bacterium]|nr:hypothetical protein [Rhodothermales bacterium]MBO6780798.1 hypothetical protein [Rhodothermales bacterium]
MIYRTASEIDFAISDLPRVEGPRRVLMTAPTHFQVHYVINPHMEGHIGSVDTTRAQNQWLALKDAYDRIGIETHEIQGAEGLPDMVFCANQTLPVPALDARPPKVVLSRMNSEHRMAEVPAYAEYFGEQGYELLDLQENKGTFEGMGDAIWHPGRYLLWGGFGFRTDLEVYKRMAKALDLRILIITLEDPDFYHLDTCFSVLDDQSVLIYPGAFDDEGLGLVNALFERVIEAPEDESRRLFACNAHCPDGKHVIIQEGCTETVRLVGQAGFTPVEVNTDEFLKAGGSVFCMKQMFW